jgi:hypothetical protein
VNGGENDAVILGSIPLSGASGAVGGRGTLLALPKGNDRENAMNHVAILERKLASAPARVAATRPSGLRALAWTGALIYGAGMLFAMLSSAATAHNWAVLLLVLPQCVLAVLAGAGAMAGALLAPDPYVRQPGHPPGNLPDFN